MGEVVESVSDGRGVFDGTVLPVGRLGVGMKGNSRQPGACQVVVSAKAQLE